MNRGFFYFSLILTIGLAFGCSGGSSPLLPDMSPDGLNVSNLTAYENQGTPGKAIWGIWDMALDTRTMEVTAVPVRGAEFTVDVVAFLQYPKGTPANLQIHITDNSQWLDQGILGVGVGLTHPFPGLNQFVGFDVIGVVLGSGSLTSQVYSDVVYSDGENDLKLLNADGYTRWFNPTEFQPDGTILRFVPGYLGTTDLGFINATINGYKYYTDGLAEDEDLFGYMQVPGSVEARGKFAPGSVNWREFMLKFPMSGGNPLVKFQYAVVANWVLPDPAATGEPNVIDVPDDYPNSANMQENFFYKVTDNSTLWHEGDEGGGNLTFDVEIYDWAGYIAPGSIPNEISKIIVESPEPLIPGGYAELDGATLALTAQPGSSDCSSVFTIDIAGCMPQSTVEPELLITIEQVNGEFSPGAGIPALVDDPLAGYFTFVPKILDEAPYDALTVINPNGGETLWMALDHEILWEPGDPSVSTVSIEFSTDDFTSEVIVLTDSTENDGTFVWVPIPNIETDTGLIRVSNVNGPEMDQSDNYFSIGVPVWLEFQDEVPVNLDTVLWNPWPNTTEYDGTYSEWSPALSQDYDGLAHITWHAEKVFPAPEPDPGYRQARDTGIRSMDGDAWDGDAYFFTWGGTAQEIHQLRKDMMKVAPAANNTTFAAIQHWSIYFSVDVDHFPNNHLYYNAYCLDNRIYKNCEIACDSEWLYMISDGYVNGINDGPGIYSQRVPTPDYQWPGSPGSMNTLTNNGEISHVRSWAFHDNALVIAYYTNGGTIQLLKQTDQASDTWDDTEVIFDGIGYTEVAHPGLSMDPSGRLFAVWTCKEDVSGEYQVLVSMKADPLASWTTPLVAASSTSAFNDCHISTSYEQVLLPTGASEYLVLIGYEQDGIVYSKISPKDLWAFLPFQIVSDEEDTSQDPDTMCFAAPYLYDALFAWSIEVLPDDWDIRFRNGDFVTP